MQRTKTDSELAASEAAHADDPERAEVIHRARRFKASWIELAEALTEVRKGSQWKAWGFGSFEEYSRTELRLKPETVDKLTGSYQFLQKRAPEVLRRDGLSSPIPSYQSVDFLRRAEDQEGAPDEAVSEIRRRVLDEGTPLPTIARQFRDAVFPIDDAERTKRDAHGIKSVAARLKELLGSTRAVTKKLAAETTEVLERLLSAIEEREEKAA